MWRYLFLCMVACLLVGIPADTKAAAPTLVVGYGEVRVLEDPLYRYGGILIVEGGTLTIMPGVTIELERNGVIENHGVFQVQGSATQAVTVRGLNGESWGTIHSWPGSRTEFEYLTLEYYSGPIHFDSPDIALRFVSFFDARDGMVYLGRDGDAWGGEKTWSHLVFRGKSGRTLDLGLWLRASVRIIRYEEIMFIDSRRSTTKFIGIRTRTQSQTFYSNVLHSTCPLVHSRIAFNELVMRLVDCEAPILPVLFIPGFGASINLRQLSAPIQDRTTDAENWKLPMAVVPDYYTFLDAFKKMGVAYEVATYDWRLPPADIVDEYLIPTIDALSKKSGGNQIRIVAHSYGGLVAQAYMKTNKYRHDVASVSILGTPTLGVTAAYRAWYGGEVPSGFSVLRSILSWWRYREQMQGEDAAQTLQRNVPSLAELLPRYPFLRRGEEVGGIELGNSFRELPWPNDVEVDVVVSDTIATESQLRVSEGGGNWPYGMPIDTSVSTGGDGLVPANSVYTGQGTKVLLTGSHASLPKQYRDTFIEKYYKKYAVRVRAIVPRHARDMLWWLFDCDIDVVMSDPGGMVYSTFEGVDNETIFQGGELTWIYTPSQSGDFEVAITANEDGEVRWMVEDSQPVTLQMKAGETVQFTVIPVEDTRDIEDTLSLPPTGNTPPSINQSEGVKGEKASAVAVQVTTPLLPLNTLNSATYVTDLVIARDVFVRLQKPAQIELTMRRPAVLYRNNQEKQQQKATETIDIRKNWQHALLLMAIIVTIALVLQRIIRTVYRQKIRWPP